MGTMKRLLASLFVLLLAAPAVAAEKAVGYGEDVIQMVPLMAPYKSSNGVRYEVLTVRLKLGLVINERNACFSVPIIHDKFVQYLYGANLTAADFTGERRKVLAEKLYDIATKTTAKGFFAGVELIDIEPRPDDPKAAPPMTQKSMTLSAQCK